MPGRAVSPRYDAAVIGLGPVGATLANLLGVCGLRTLVIDKEAGIYDLPRAVHFDDQVMRVFQAAGVAEEVAQVSRINPGMRFVDTDGELLLDWPRPQVIGPQGWYASYRFHQPDLERILRRALERFDHVEMRTGTECIGLADDGSQVELQLKDQASGHIEPVTAVCAIGCDGARSFVRKSIGSGADDLGFNERWLVIDVLLKQDRPDLGDHTIQNCDPGRPSTYVRCPGNRRRWEMALRPDEDTDEASTDGAVWNFLARWLAPHEAELERRAVYTFRSVIASRWREGRVLLAGDAAHQTPPFMGQGMCTGIRDAANLAWKLAAFVHGKAGGELLDTYQSERSPHAREYIETAIRLGRLINTSNTSEALEAAFPQQDGSARMASIAPPLGPGLLKDGDAAAGRPAIQPRLADGRLLDDACGYRFALLADHTLWSNYKDRLSPQAGDLSIITGNGEPEVRQYLEELGTKAVLIRPDRYVLGTADTPDELDHLLRILPTTGQ